MTATTRRHYRDLASATAKLHGISTTRLLIVGVLASIGTTITKVGKTFTGAARKVANG